VLRNSFSGAKAPGQNGGQRGEQIQAKAGMLGDAYRVYQSRSESPFYQQYHIRVFWLSA